MEQVRTPRPLTRSGADIRAARDAKMASREARRRARQADEARARAAHIAAPAGFSIDPDERLNEVFDEGEWASITARLNACADPHAAGRAAVALALVRAHATDLEVSDYALRVHSEGRIELASEILAGAGW